MIPRILLAAVLLSPALLADDLAFGTDKITFSGSATKDEAQALGDAFKKMGFFSDNGSTVLLDKSAGSTVITFTVVERKWRPETLMAFEQIARVVAPSVGGFPVKVRILTTTGEFKTESNVPPPVMIGKDSIMASGAASNEQAKTLGDGLKTAGYLQDRGVSVMLYKDDGPMTVSFIVNATVLPDTAIFESILRELAPSLGGLPMRMRLVDTNLSVKRQMLVHPALQVGQKDKLYYSDAATEAEARAVAVVLQNEQFFDDSGAIVFLYKGNAGAIVSFMLNSFNNPEQEQRYTSLGRAIAPVIGWFPIKVRLVSTDFETKKEFEIQ